ncbi:hypothetical protein SAMN05216249_12821 [Acetitomaculum ruminis DSM 5522]|uniref:ABC-2 family transporter protein n=1 Tax=Acetitomaculum ruminis DSM 5522 TaxID=1120918 RepID=A0A1I1AMW7_9FIRM|nr:hypothetical protein [Acetitomaculum ruminis]SFB37808.1 hypothetical protein SAMN05216249_12821 [Acetitomaculum ruminis DSM 5522]
MVKEELKRALSNKKFWIMLIIGILIGVTYFFQYVLIFAKSQDTILEYYKDSAAMLHPVTVFEGWMDSTSSFLQPYLYYMILPLLVSGAYADSFFLEKKSGYLKNVLIRESKKRYYLSKIIAVFIIGGIVFVAPLIINFCMTAAVLPTFTPSITNSMSAPDNMSFLYELYYTFPLLYVFIFMVIDFIYAGLTACIAMLCGFYVEHRFLIYAMPFVVWMFLHSALCTLGFDDYSPVHFLNPGYSSVKGQSIVIYLLIFIIFIFLILKKNQSEDVF